MNDIDRIRKCLTVLNEECAYHKKEETREKIIKILKDNYIPKSKVEEKIGEYKEKGNSVGIPHLYGAEIELLQSLLGKE